MDEALVDGLVLLLHDARDGTNLLRAARQEARPEVLVLCRMVDGQHGDQQVEVPRDQRGPCHAAGRDGAHQPRAQPELAAK